VAGAKRKTPTPPEGVFFFPRPGPTVQPPSSFPTLATIRRPRTISASPVWLWPMRQCYHPLPLGVLAINGLGLGLTGGTFPLCDTMKT
jgi:hypothetical protein